MTARFTIPSLAKATLLLVGLLAGCGLQNSASNPFDPNSPKQTQARATLVGNVDVEAPEGMPLDASGVIVSLEGANVTARTGPDGSFTLVEVPAGTYVLSLSKEGYDTVRTSPIDVPIWYASHPNVSLGRFQLKLSRGSIGGVAKLEGSTNHAGTTVTVEGTTHVALTNENGEYLIAGVPIGTYVLTFRKPAFKDATLPNVVVTSNSTTTAPDVTVASDPGSIKGKVNLTGLTNAGGVTVTAQGTTLNGNSNTAQVTTDDTGAYAFPAIAAGVYDVSFQKDGFRTQHVPAAISPAVEVDLDTVTLSPATGQVIGVAKLDMAADNSGILVVLTASQTSSTGSGSADGGADAGGLDGGSPDDAGTADAGTDADGGSMAANEGKIVGTILTSRDGTYSFANIPVGDYSMTLSADGYHAVTLSGLHVAADQTLTVPTTVLTSQPASIQGQVFLEDLVASMGDMAGTQVGIAGTTATAMTASDGTFVLSNVGVGPHIIAMKRTGYVQNNVFVSTAPGQDVTLPQVTLPVARGSVGGTITAEGRTDNSGILVTLSGGIAGDSYSALTDATGAFLISNVRVGTYSLVASLANYQTYTSPTFEVAAAQTASYASTPAVLSILRISSLGGTVTAGNGAAQDGTTVLLSGSDLNGTTVTASLSTQLDGSYQFDHLPPGSYAVAFTHPGYNPSALPPTALIAGQKVTLPTVQLSIAIGGLSGTILLAGQLDSSGTLVSLNTGATTLTAADGSFSFPGLVAGTYNVTASHATYATVTLPPQTVPPNGSVVADPVTLQLDTSGSVTGSVTLEGAPTYDGVTVALTGTDSTGAPVTLSTTTDSTGTYKIASVPAGNYTVNLSKAGFVNGRLDGITLNPGQALTAPAANLAISRGNVSGQILAQGLKDSSGTVVSIDGTSLSGVTSADGSFSIGGVPVGPYTLTARRAGFNSYTSPTFSMVLGASLTVPAMPVTLSLATNATLTGTVVLETGADPLNTTATLNGTLITGAAITAKTAQAASDGTYTFSGLSPGTYTVTLARTGFVTSSLPPVNMTAGNSATLPSFTLPLARGTVTGTITASGATSNAGSLVQLANTSFVALTSGNGLFTISGVPAGTYTAIASRAGYVSTSVSVTLAPGGTFNFPATTLALDTTATIAGTCTATNATSQAGSTVSLSGNDLNGLAVSATATTATDSSFSLRNLPAGSYTVTCSRLGFGSTTSGQITLNAGQQFSGVGLALAGPTGNVVGTVALSAGVIPGFTPETDLSGITVVISGPAADLPQSLVAQTNSAGAFSFKAVPVSQTAAAYTVRTSKPGYGSASGTVTVVLAQTATVAAMTLTALPSNLSGTVTVPPPAVNASGFTPVVAGTAFNGSAYGPRSADGPTGTNGVYTFSNVPAGNYTVSLSATAYNPVTGNANVAIPSSGTPTVTGPTLALTRATGALAGRVLASANGSGLNTSGDVAGVTVSVSGSGLSSGLVATTDASGNWSLPAIPVGTSGSYTITASRAGYISASTTATVAAGTTTSAPDLTLVANVFGLSGTIVVEGGADNSGVTGSLTGTAFNGTTFTKSADAATNAAGAITFSAIPAGTYTVTFADGSSYTPLVLSPVIVAGTPATLPSLSGTIHRAVGSLTGRVLTSAGSTGMTLQASDVTGVSVSVADPSLTSTLVAVTDATGHYTLSNVPAPVTAGASYQVIASKANFVQTSTSATVTPGSTPVSVADLTLTPASYTVSGCVVVPAPAPDSTGVTASLAGVAFNGTAYTKSAVGPSSGTTCGGQAGASYSFSNVPNGTYTITLTRAGYSAASIPSVSVAGGAVTVPSASLGRSTGSISGTVTASDGGTGLTVDPGSALVALTGADLLGQTYQATTDSSGHYAFSGVPVSPTSAPYTVTVTKANYTASGTTTVVVPVSSTISASTIALTVNNGSVSGTVSVPAPAANSSGVSATLTGTAFNGVAWTSSAVTTNAAGSYSFAKVPPGTYTLTLTLNGMSTILVPGIAVTAGQSTTVPAQTMARATGALYGQVTWNANGTGITQGANDLLGVSITVTGSGLSASYGATTDANGNWSIASIPVPLTGGVTYTITASKAGFITTSTTQAVVANTSTSVTNLTMNVASFNLPGTVTVAGAADNSGVTGTLTGVAFNGTAFSKTTSAPSSSSGAFQFTAVPVGTYSVSLQKNASYAPFTIPSVVVAPPPATLPTLSGTLQRATGGFSGSVVAVAGTSGLTVSNPADASGASVVVSDPSFGTTTYATVTDGSGNFAVSGIPAPTTPGTPYTITISKPGFTSTVLNNATTVLNPAVPLTSIGSNNLTVASYTVSGAVYVTSPATTSAGTTVSLTGTGFNGSDFSANATGAVDSTNPLKFNYTFANVPAVSGHYTLTFTAPGFAPTTGKVVVTSANVTVPDTTLTTRATGNLVGTVAVTDGGTGLPITGAERGGITVRLTGSELPNHTPLTVQTDAGGNFQFTNVPVNFTSGNYQVGAYKDANYTTSASVAADLTANATTAVAGLSLAINPGQLIGTVELHDRTQASGDPASYAAVPVTLTGVAFNGAAFGPITISCSASNGNVVFQPVPPGSYTLSAWLAQHGSAATSSTYVAPGDFSFASTLRLQDQAAPTTPTISASHQSPTSATSVNLVLLQASTDPTAPVANFRDYAVSSCIMQGYHNYTQSLSCAAEAYWDGTQDGTSHFTLYPGYDNYFFVQARDWNNNRSAQTSLIIHSENIPPAAPTTVHVDNRNGSARISWKPGTGSTSALPVAGYKVYYGPQLSTSPADYTGTVASQGPSPIDVGSATEINLTGLANGNAFYVAVSAYDGVVDPKPNESALSSALKVNPNSSPFDRAVHQVITQNGTSIALIRDDVLVASGTSGAFTVQDFSYQQYGTLQANPSIVSSTRARYLVADGRSVFAFDSGFGGSAGTTGLDIIDGGDPTNIGTTPYYVNLFSTFMIDHIVPAHRAGIGATAQKTHGVMTYKNTTNNTYYIATYSALSDHVGIALDSNATALSTQVKPDDVKVVGNYVFVLNNSSFDAYTISADFTTITTTPANTHFSLTGSSTYVPHSMVVDWPRIYFLSGSNSDTLNLTTVTGTSPLTVNLTPTVVGYLTNQGRHMTIAGDTLLVSENQNWSTTTIEAFSLATPTAPVRIGSYELNSGGELGYTAQTFGLAVYGSNAFVLSTSTAPWVTSVGPANLSTLDVVEMGGPRVMSHVNAFAPTAGTSTMFEGLSVAVRGTRAIGYVSNSSASYALANVDLLSGFATGTAYTITQTFNSNGYPLRPGCSEYPCLPVVLAGDYAFALQESGGEKILVYDISTPAAMSNATPIVTITASKYVTGIAVVNDYLYATETTNDSTTATTTWLERWDISDLVHPVGPTSPPVGSTGIHDAYSIDIVGRYAYVATNNGYCVQDLALFTSSPTCTAISGGLTNVSYDAGRLYETSLTAYSPVNVYARSGTLLSSLTGPSLTYNVNVFGTGPNVFAGFTSSSTNPVSAMMGFDLMSGLSQPLGSDPTLRAAAQGPFAIAGSLMVVPDQQAGLVLIRTY